MSKGRVKRQSESSGKMSCGMQVLAREEGKTILTSKLKTSGRVVGLDLFFQSEPQFGGLIMSVLYYRLSLPTDAATAISLAFFFGELLHLWEARWPHG